MQKGNALIVIGMIVIAVGVVVLSIFLYHPEQKPQPAPTATQTTEMPKVKTLNEKLIESFDKGLSYLMKSQLENGAWPNPMKEADVAFTSFAIMVIAKSPQKYQETYKTQIEKGAKYVVEHVQANGAIIDSEKPPTYAVYKTSLALAALTNLDKEKYKNAIAKATSYLTTNQFGPEDGDAQSGGWGYSERGATATMNANLSTSEFAMMALHESGLPKDSETWQRAVEFLDKIQNSSEYNKFRVTTNDGGFAYSPVESKAGEETLADGTKIYKSYASMTYAGLLSFIYANVDKKDPRVQAAYNWIRKNYSLEENIGLRTDANPKLGKQGLYYYYNTFAKALDALGEKTIITEDKTEHKWAKELAEKLISLQKLDGAWKNDFEERWFEGFEGLATSYSLLALNTCRKWLE